MAVLCCGGRGGGYLESLPVGPNHSDSMLLPGFLLQSPQLPARLFEEGGRQETRGREQSEGR